LFEGQLESEPPIVGEMIIGMMTMQEQEIANFLLKLWIFVKEYFKRLNLLSDTLGRNIMH
jgi:hypothetical protein